MLFIRYPFICPDDASAENLFTVIEDSALSGGDIPQGLINRDQDASILPRGERCRDGGRPVADFHLAVEGHWWRAAADPVDQAHKETRASQLTGSANDQGIGVGLWFEYI